MSGKLPEKLADPGFGTPPLYARVRNSPSVPAGFKADGRWKNSLQLPELFVMPARVLCP